MIYGGLARGLISKDPTREKTNSLAGLPVGEGAVHQ